MILICLLILVDYICRIKAEKPLKATLKPNRQYIYYSYLSWYRAPLWDLRPDITSCRNVAVWNLRSCFCGAPSLARGRVWNLQYNHSRSRSYFTTVSQYVLLSSTLVGLVARYYLLSECCCMKLAVLYLWGALFDERTGLQFSV
jgi:hypothetical protein